MACPGVRDYCFRRGDTCSISITLSTDEAGSNPIDITGDSFLLAVDPSDAPEDSSNNIYVLNGVIDVGASGTVAFTPSAAQAEAAPPGEYFYDIQWIRSGDGRVKTVLTGSWTIVQDVTK